MQRRGHRGCRPGTPGFYATAYHLKDLLKMEMSIPKEAIEAAIDNTPELALLCDLANLTKHGRLDRPPRSGVAPEVVKREGRSSVCGWQLILTIQHGERALDGLSVARSAVEAWRTKLLAWELT